MPRTKKRRKVESSESETGLNKRKDARTSPHDRRISSGRQGATRQREGSSPRGVLEPMTHRLLVADHRKIPDCPSFPVFPVPGSHEYLPGGLSQQAAPHPNEKNPSRTSRAETFERTALDARTRSSELFGGIAIPRGEARRKRPVAPPFVGWCVCPDWSTYTGPAATSTIFQEAISGAWGAILDTVISTWPGKTSGYQGLLVLGSESPAGLPEQGVRRLAGCSRSIHLRILSAGYKSKWKGVQRNKGESTEFFPHLKRLSWNRSEKAAVLRVNWLESQGDPGLSGIALVLRKSNAPQVHRGLPMPTRPDTAQFGCVRNRSIEHVSHGFFAGS